MLKNSLLILLSYITFNSFSQINNFVKFNEVTHNFGDLKEEKGNASFAFVFTNISKVPIFIRKVETSCGCTTPKYNTDSVLPGAQGEILAIYETSGKSGNFHKNLFVYFNTSDNFQSLAIEGNVFSIPRKEYKQQEYSTNYGNLAFSETVAQFDNILSTQTKYKVIKVYNYNAYPIKILEMNEMPDYVSVSLSDSSINAEDSIKITIKLSGTGISEIGDLFKRIGFLTDDEVMTQKFLYIRFSLKEDFSVLSKKEIKNAPHIEFLRKFPIPLGTRTAGAIFKDTIRFSNTGKSVLIIRKAVPSCNCLSFTIAKKELKPGESVVINIKFDLINQPIGEQKKILKIFTNDPLKSEIDIPFSIKIIQ